MANITKIMTVINKEIKRRFAKKVPLFTCVNRQYDKRYEAYGASSGESIQIKRPQRVAVYESQVMTPQIFEEQTETLSNIYWAGSALTFSAAELTDDLLEPNNLKLFADDNLEAAVDSIAATVHYNLSNYMLNNTYNNVGTPGTAVSNHQVLMQASARLSSYGCPMSDRFAILTPEEAGSLNYGMASLYNPQQQIAKQLVDGFLGPIAGFDIYQAGHMASITRGTATNTTPLVDGANQTGTSILLKGVGNAVTYVYGDKFTIAGVKAVHPLTRKTLPFLQDFTVIEAATSSAGGAVTLKIYPPITTSGAYQTVSGSPTDGAAITIKGTASTGYVRGIAAHRDSFVFATQRIKDVGAPAESTYMEDGITFKLTLGSDISNLTSISRIDMKYGMGRLVHEHAAVIWGGAVA